MLIKIDSFSVIYYLNIAKTLSTFLSIEFQLKIFCMLNSIERK